MHRRRVWSAPPSTPPPDLRHHEHRELSEGWKKLPMELRVMIFSKLKGLNDARIALVSKGWRFEYFYSRLHVDLSVDNVGLLDEDTVRSLVILSPRARFFSLNGQKWLWFLYSRTDALLKHISDSLPTLPSINGVYCTITDVSRLQTMARRLSLERGLSEPMSYIRDSSEVISEQVPRYLSLFDCGAITDSSIERVRSIAQSVPQSLETITDTVTDTGLQLSQSLPELSIQNITDKGLHHITHLLPKSLDIAAPEDVPDTGVRHIAAHMPHLKFLDLAMCDVSDVGMQYIASGLPHLLFLDVSSCSRVTDVGIAYVANCLPKLRSLNLSKCSIGIDGLKCIADNLLNLECLNLSDCKAMDDEDLENIVTNLSNLTELYIGRCEDVSDDGIASVARNLKRLTDLSVAHCNITDIGLNTIARSLLSLERLDLCYCYNISDAGVREIALHLRLKELKMECCYNLMDEGLAEIGRSMTSLDSLFIGGCSSISEEAINRLTDTLPHTQVMTELVDGIQ